MQSLPAIEGKNESSGSSLVSQVRAILKRAHASSSIQEAGSHLMEGLRCLVDAEHAVLLRTIPPKTLRSAPDDGSVPDDGSAPDDGEFEWQRHQDDFHLAAGKNVATKDADQQKDKASNRDHGRGVPGA